MKRVFLIVLDSCGIGELPDASQFGDKSCNTLKRISCSAKFSADNTVKLGLGNIDGIDFLQKTKHPLASVARLAEKSAGKDTTTGHWEIAGVVSETPMPTYPYGFPREITEAFSRMTGRGILCNKPYSGTAVIKDYGREHCDTGNLIIYTSADSVFQIAAHTKIVPTEQLYDYCLAARKLLCGKNAVGRVIARPFAGEYPNYYRTAGRRDFSLDPPAQTMLDAIKQAGKTVYAIGKISDIFAGRGVTEKVITHSNAEGMSEALKALEKTFNGLCFINLVDFDMLYGHRQDIDGYAEAFACFDKWIPEFISKMGKDDICMITADHGCDPGDSHTDHTREYTPLLIYGEKIKPVNYGTRPTFADIAATVTQYLDVDYECCGENLFDLR